MKISHDQECNDIRVVISNEMTPLPILLAAIFFGTGNCSYKIVHGLEAFSSNSRLDVREVKTETVRVLLGYFGMKFLSLEVW